MEDIVPIERRPEMSFGSLFDLSSQFCPEGNLFTDDPFAGWAGSQMF
jgi:hypothetical protein